MQIQAELGTNINKGQENCDGSYRHQAQKRWNEPLYAFQKIAVPR